MKMNERERERERTYHICLFKGHISFLKNHFFHPFFPPSKVAIKAIHYLQKRIFLSPMIPGGYYKKRGKKGGEVGRGEIIGGGLYAGSVKPSPYTTKMWTLMFVSQCAPCAQQIIVIDDRQPPPCAFGLFRHNNQSGHHPSIYHPTSIHHPSSIIHHPRKKTKTHPN